MLVGYELREETHLPRRQFVGGWVSLRCMTEKFRVYDFFFSFWITVDLGRKKGGLVLSCADMLTSAGK